MLTLHTPIGLLLEMAHKLENNERGQVTGICIYPGGMVRVFYQQGSVSHQLELPAAAGQPNGGQNEKTSRAAASAAGQ